VTLMESLMASAILAGAVVTVIYAITAGQQHAYQAKEQIEASLAAQEVMAQIIKRNYTDIPSWPWLTSVGGFNILFTPASSDQDVAGIGVRVNGTIVKLKVMTPDWNRTVLETTHFVPAPPS